MRSLGPLCDTFCPLSVHLLTGLSVECGTVHPITVSLVTATSWITGTVVSFLFVLFPYAVHGCLFYMFSQVSHIQVRLWPNRFLADFGRSGTDLWLNLALGGVLPRLEGRR